MSFYLIYQFIFIFTIQLPMHYGFVPSTQNVDTSHTNSNINGNNHIKVVEQMNMWDDGEVPWFIENENNEPVFHLYHHYNDYTHNHINSNIINSNTKHSKKRRSNKNRRQKSLFLYHKKNLRRSLDESKIKLTAFTSGVLQIVYYNVQTPDNIMSDIENMQNIHNVNVGINGNGNINEIYNTDKSEFWLSNNLNTINLGIDVLITLITFLGYKNSKKLEITQLIDSHRSETGEKRGSNYYVYQKMKRQSRTVILIIILIFTKNIQNAI